MKNIINNKIFLVVITAIICSSLSVYAVKTFSANQVKYQNTPLDTTLDNLYQNALTISQMKSQHTELVQQDQTYQSELDKYKNAGSIAFTSSTSTQSFNIGFKPDYVSCFANTENVNTNSGYTIIVYNKSFDSENIIRTNQAASTKVALGNFISINNNGFTWNIVSDKWVGTQIYCSASK